MGQIGSMIKKIIYEKGNSCAIGVWRMVENSAMTTECVSWSVPENEIVKEDFLFRNMVKWDSCSHFNFTGGDTRIKDSYYHICGVSHYIKFMQLLWISHQCWQEENVKSGLFIDEKEEAEELHKNILFKDIIIRETPWTEYDTYIWEAYNKEEK